MLESMKDYVYERRWRLTRAATVTGSVYFCGRYTLDRVEEVRYAVVRDKLARE
jgi:peroxin-3